MGRLRIDIAGDGATATVVVGPGPAVDDAELRRGLADAGVRAGIDAEACAALVRSLADTTHTGSYVVARGAPAQPGTDGRVELLPPGGLQPGTADPSGRIDYRERGQLVPARTGDVIARVVAPTVGRPGQDVRGRPSTARDGQPARLQLGPGVRLDGDAVVALRDGVRAHVPPKLDVVAMTEHGGDVDYESGNLHTEGSLLVRGDVTQGFAVTAAHDVQVLGSVFDAAVRADGSVRVEAGISGATCRVQAGTDLACRFATASTLQAGGTIEFGDAATQCTARGGSVSATTGRGTVLGGDLRARERIEVRVAGNALGTRTTLRVADVLEETAELIRAHHGDQRLADRSRVEARGAGVKGGKALRAAVRAGDPVLQRTLALRQRQRELLRTACIDVTETLHPGVLVVFGERSRLVDTPRHAVRLRWNEADDTIVEEPLP